MEDYSPASLPPITSVQAVDLRGLVANRVNQYMQASGDAPSVTLRGDGAQRIAKLWRELPSGQQMRCHSPPYGLRFRSGEAVVLEASLCWECNNIFGLSGDREVHFEFDAEQSVSKLLFSEIRDALEPPA